jgi:hypothetical protein
MVLGASRDEAVVELSIPVFMRDGVVPVRARSITSARVVRGPGARQVRSQPQKGHKTQGTSACSSPANLHLDLGALSF